MQRGFSLLEVLVAFSILALSLGILMQIFSGSLRNADISHDQAQALTLAQSVLASAGIEAPLAAGEATGTLNEKYRWTLLVTPVQYESATGDINQLSPTGILELWEVAVRIVWQGSDARERDLRLVTMRVQAPSRP